MPLWICVLFVPLAAACANASETSAAPHQAPAARTQRVPAAATQTAPSATPLALFKSCTTQAMPVHKTTPFRHRRSKLIAKLGRRAHSAQDLIATLGQSIHIPGKFAYGRVSKDMEDETVEVFLDLCERGWRALGSTLTDDDGRTSLSVSDTLLPGSGIYTLTQRMQGDASTITSRLTIVPPQSKFIVFDVDGTLTVSDEELFDELSAEYTGSPSASSSARPFAGAAALSQAWAAKGYLLIYMTGRPYWLASLTRRWLRTHGFAPGHLHTTDRNRDILPSRAGVGEFKAKYLKSLVDLGIVLERAYGNAETDIYAYRKSGIPLKQTHIIGPHAGKNGTQGISKSYISHVKWVKQQPTAKQPFRWSR